MPGRPDWSDNMCVRHARDQSNRINYPRARYNSGPNGTLDCRHRRVVRYRLPSRLWVVVGGWRWLWEAHAQNSGIRIGPIWLILFEIDRNEIKKNKTAPTTRPAGVGAERIFRISMLDSCSCVVAFRRTRWSEYCETTSKCNSYCTHDGRTGRALKCIIISWFESAQSDQLKCY